MVAHKHLHQVVDFLEDKLKVLEHNLSNQLADYLDLHNKNLQQEEDSLVHLKRLHRVVDYLEHKLRYSNRQE